ncbi:sigma-70 family RNA polymerase sigma factor [Sphingobacterium sp.]|uniref:RNA polymerase sigma factor n=1 Tax=Sphingobacterium sp. TaxID=341027 RepID=UPI0028A06B52|nr:sigma-70 family RNA polymerase sigma factor [Sphingobacterium sp.]
MTVPIQNTDEGLVELIHQNQTTAFHELYERYKAAMLIFASQRVSRDAAEDLVQDVFLSLWKNRGQLEIKERIGGYLFKALRTKIIDHMSKGVHAQKYLDSIDDFAKSHTGTDAKVREETFLRRIEELLRRCGPQYQTILKMRLEGYNNQEIADSLGLSEKTVRNQSSNLMKVLRSKLSTWILFIFF